MKGLLGYLVERSLHGGFGSRSPVDRQSEGAPQPDAGMPQGESASDLQRIALRPRPYGRFEPRGLAKGPEEEPFPSGQPSRIVSGAEDIDQAAEQRGKDTGGEPRSPASPRPLKTRSRRYVRQEVDGSTQRGPRQEPRSGGHIGLTDENPGQEPRQVAEEEPRHRVERTPHRESHPVENPGPVPSRDQEMAPTGRPAPLMAKSSNQRGTSRLPVIRPESAQNQPAAPVEGRLSPRRPQDDGAGTTAAGQPVGRILSRESVRPVRSQSERASSQSPPRVQVSIGRVEIRATYAPAPAPPARRPSTGMTLETYLEQRGTSS